MWGTTERGVDPCCHRCGSALSSPDPASHAGGGGKAAVVDIPGAGKRGKGRTSQEGRGAHVGEGRGHASWTSHARGGVPPSRSGGRAHVKEGRGCAWRGGVGEGRARWGGKGACVGGYAWRGGVGKGTGALCGCRVE